MGSCPSCQITNAAHFDPKFVHINFLSRCDKKIYFIVDTSMLTHTYTSQFQRSVFSLFLPIQGYTYLSKTGFTCPGGRVSTAVVWCPGGMMFIDIGKP